MMHKSALRSFSALLICLMLTAVHNAHADSPWRQTAPLLTPRSGAGVVEVDGVIHAIGGIDGKRFLKSGESSVIQDDGTLAPWRAASELNVERGFFGVAAHGGFVYAVGGGNGPSGHNLLRSVERAAILPDGRLGPWRKEAQALTVPRRCAKAVAVGDYLYAIGGFGGTLFDTVERARFEADGGLGPWEIVKGKLTVPRYIHAATAAQGHLYILGGHAQQGGMGVASVEYASLGDVGGMGGWRQGAAMANGRYGLAAAGHGGFLYALGGMNGAAFFDAVEKSAIARDGAPGPWVGTTPLPAPLADFGAVVYRDWIYVVGGTSQRGYFNNVLYARIGEQGDIVPAAIGGAQATALPTPANRVALANVATVTQVLDGGTYSYLEVDTGTAREWLAAAHTDIAAGDRIRYSDGIWMEDFFSKHLQRRFTAIRFVGNLEKETAE